MANIQIKSVPDETHEMLRKRAAEADMTLRDYLLDLIRRDLARPTREEWFRRIRSRPPGAPVDVVGILTEERKRRDASGASPK
ncbi:MAG: hypothetical protein GEU79_15190 [Acidimicrobiia bacterium]|nr:hypothetical protein [Acidimicrobiia bacterium]